MTLMILRPQPGADRTAKRAREAGFETRVYPIFAMEPLDWAEPDPGSIDALLITSANTVIHGGSGLVRYMHLPAFAVGATTAKALREAGFLNVVVGERGVQDLIRTMETGGHARVLHLSGRDVRPYGTHSLGIGRAVVYAAVEAGDAAGLAAQLEPGMTLMLHSPRAGARVAALVPLRDRATLCLVAISPQVLEVAGPGWAGALAADLPTDKAMLALAATLCD